MERAPPPVCAMTPPRESRENGLGAAETGAVTPTRSRAERASWNGSPSTIRLTVYVSDCIGGVFFVLFFFFFCLERPRGRCSSLFCSSSRFRLPHPVRRARKARSFHTERHTHLLGRAAARTTFCYHHLKVVTALRNFVSFLRIFRRPNISIRRSQRCS